MWFLPFFWQYNHLWLQFVVFHIDYSSVFRFLWISAFLPLSVAFTPPKVNTNLGINLRMDRISTEALLLFLRWFLVCFFKCSPLNTHGILQKALPSKRFQSILTTRATCLKSAFLLDDDTRFKAKEHMEICAYFDLPCWVETGVRAWCITELSCKYSMEIKDEGRDIRKGRKGGFTQKDEFALHTMWSAHLKLFRLLINDWINLINMNNPMQL